MQRFCSCNHRERQNSHLQNNQHRFSRWRKDELQRRFWFFRYYSLCLRAQQDNQMIGINPSTPIYLCTMPCDMRKSFTGLCGMVINFMDQHPGSGHLFVFVNRPCDKMKILLWDRNGFWLFYKRLEQGCFQLPSFSVHPESSISISYDQLIMILEGIDISSIKRRKRLTNRTA